jgi:aminopeptidase YwaD
VRRRVLGGALLSVAFSSAAAPCGARIDPADLAEPLHVLTSDAFAGRGTGTAGAEMAARYIAGEFAKTGLEPLGVADPNAVGVAPDGSGWFQPFPATVGATLGPGNSLAARISGRSVDYGLERDFVPSTLSGSGNAQGPVVFAGYGVASRAAGRDDYAGRDVRGRIVLLLAGAPTEDPKSPWAAFAGIYHKVVFARDRGATAVIVAATEDSEPSRWNTNRGFNDEGLPVLLVSRRIASAWLGADGWTMDAVREKLSSEPWPLTLSVRLSLSTDVRKTVRPAANVAGLLRGSDPDLAREYVVIGAHYDHLGSGGPTSLAADRRPAIHPGADDNASGTAGLIELARRLAEGPRPRRSILFLAFSGEELGLVGSTHYVRHPLVPLERTVAMLNMDMIGRLREDRLAVIGTGTSPEWPALLEDLNREARFRLISNDEPFGASDQHSFYLGGVPVLSFFTGKHPDYHTPGDTAEKINRTGEARILALISGCAARLAGDTARPRFRELDPPLPEPTRVALGIIPDYAEEASKGVAIAETSARGPARGAGLRPGDVIVRLGGHSVLSMHDYRIAIAEFRAGDVISGVVLRDGRELPFTATLPAAPR